jgi:hypothetical protein
MSISLKSIDCPCLTADCLNNLIEQYSIHTINDFTLWLFNSSDRNKYLSSNTIECIQSCIIAHTASIRQREISERKLYKVNYFLFDKENLFQNRRHLIFIYENFNQNQWNEFFNIFLIRLFIENKSIKIKYFNTNISLFDIKYFDSNYSHLIKIERNHFLEKFFYFNHYFDLDTFEQELILMENNLESFEIIIIDDLFSLIKPYLNLDKHIKGKILQLTYRLNRLAQKQSILILSGIIFNRNRNSEDYDTRLNSFHADKYVLFQSLPTMEKEICVRIMNDRYFKLNLDDWRKVDTRQCSSNSVTCKN